MLRPSWVIITAAAGGVACVGDDAEPDPECGPDYVGNWPNCDHPPDDPWNPPSPELCGEAYEGTDLWISDEDGGHIWIENQIDPDGIPRVLATAHFFDEQAIRNAAFPRVNEDPVMPLACNWVGGTGGTGSTLNPMPEQVWPFGDASDDMGATATFAPGERNYLDVGDAITLRADGLAPFELTRYENHTTPFAGGSYHDLSYDPAPSKDPTRAIPIEHVGGAGSVPNGLRLEIELGSSAEVNETHWGFEEIDGVSLAGIEIPPRPLITSINGSPARFSGGATADENQAASLLLDPTQDLNIHYDAGESDSFKIGIVAIYQHEPSYEITHFCLHVHPGEFTLPKELFAEMAPTGSIVVGNYHHQVRTLCGEQRVDLVGTSTTSASYSFEETP